jgi:hypothetical protein
MCQMSRTHHKGILSADPRATRPQSLLDELIGCKYASKCCSAINKRKRKHSRTSTRRNLAHSVVQSIGNIRIPARIDGNAMGLVEARLKPRAVGVCRNGTVQAARQCTHHCCVPQSTHKHTHNTARAHAHQVFTRQHATTMDDTDDVRSAQYSTR